MTPWYACAFALCVALAPCGYLALCHRDPVTRLVGLETAGILEAIILLLLAESSHRASFFDIAVAMSLLAAGGGLVFVRFLERWE